MGRVHAARSGDPRIALDADTVALMASLAERCQPLGPWLFSDSEEMPHPDRLGWWWSRCRKLAGIGGAWRLHDLRHWSATLALSQGYDLATVAKRLGHSDGSTTLRIYAHAIGQRDAVLADSVAAALRVS